MVRKMLLLGRRLRCHCERPERAWQSRRKKYSIVIPAEAGIQRYLDKSFLYFWIPASAGMTVVVDSRYPPGRAQAFFYSKADQKGIIARALSLSRSLYAESILSNSGIRSLFIPGSLPPK